MNTPNNQLLSCCGDLPPLGALEGKDIAALDHLAVKLICLDGRFAGPLEEMGRLLGYRLAEQRHPSPVSFDAALASVASSCASDGAVGFRFLRRNASGALVEVSGCCAALGWQIPRVDRAVCNFDAALFEGYLRQATREQDWTVREKACLGFGAPACEFLISRESEPESDFHRTRST